MSGTAAPFDRLGTGTELALLSSRRDADVILLEMLASLPLDALDAATAGAVSAEGARLLDLDAGLAACRDNRRLISDLNWLLVLLWRLLTPRRNATSKSWHTKRWNRC